MLDLKRKNILAQRIILGIALSFLCHNFTYAAEHETVYVTGDGKDIFEVLYFNKGDALYYDINKPHNTANTIVGPSQYDLSDPYKRALEKGLSYWAEMLGPSAQNSTPTQIFIDTAEKYGNAAAGTGAVNFTTSITSNENFIKEAIQNGYPLSHLDPFNGIQPEGWKSFSEILLGENMGANRAGSEGGWYIDAETVLPNNEQAADYLGTVRHEMAHALGLIRDTATKMVDNKKAQDAYLNYLVYFSPDSCTNETAWNMHLVDQNLNKAQPGMNIVTTEQYNKIAASNPNAKVSDYFILDNLQTTAPYDTTNPRAGKVYFVGTNVTDALHGAAFDGVSGVPINGWERIRDSETKKIIAYIPELSHIQTPGMMSHVAYSNYSSFMEVELAVMQDLGYKFDRKNYFGFSEYGSDLSYTNTNGYSARNSEGTAYLPGVYNQTPLGIGLHVYGSNNNIIQAADILTLGDGAAGMRIDGAGNTVTVAKGTSVRSDGYRGIGALIAYGNNQVLNQAGTISANGEKGVGVRFDFGSSTNGACDEYRGSYIRYQREVDEKTGNITVGKNIRLADKNGYTDPTPELNGSLVKEYNLSGELSAAANAIYIGKSAFVENINVNSGASITGDITSEWKHFNTDGSYDGVKGDGSDALQLQYKGTDYAYDRYIPELVTNLNFNANINYAGNISGQDNMRIKVGSGILNYTGNADIVSVEIAKGASLLGSGSYTVHDLTANLAANCSDPNMGKVINYGTIGAATGDVNITGQLDSKGNIDVASAENGARVYLLKVDGTATIADNSLVATAKNKPFLNKEYNYLTAANGITGNIKASQLSDYVRVIGTVEGNNAFFTAKQIKNIEDTAELNNNERGVARSFNNLAPNLMQQENAVGQQAANVFYNPAGDMKKLMNSAAGAERTKLLGQTPMSSLTANSIYGRLDTNAFDGMLGVPMQVPSLAGENMTVNANVPISLDANNNLWIKMFRGFEGYGGTGGGSDLNNQSFGGVAGYDKAVGLNARLGGFFAYGKTSYSADYLNGNSSDWRLGLYGDKRNGDWEYQGYVSYGANHYDLDAYTWDGGAKLNSDFKAKIWDVGLKAKYTIPSTTEKTWKIRPYGELGYTHTSQDGYTESGSNAFAKNMDSASNNSTRAELGVEFKRRITPTSGWGGAIGYKRILSGVDPELNGTFIGGTDRFTVKTENDRNYLTYDLNAYTSLGGKWTGQAEIRGERSSNNHKEVYSISAKYHF